MSRVEALAGHGSAVVVVLDDHSLLQGLTDLRWRLDALMTGDTGTLILDVTGLERLSSATLAAMLWAQRTCQSRGGRVIVRGPNRRCREMLTRTGLATVFEVRPAGDLPLGTGRSSITPTGGNA